jgi:hypothetical protein
MKDESLAVAGRVHPAVRPPQPQHGAEQRDFRCGSGGLTPGITRRDKPQN